MSQTKRKNSSQKNTKTYHIVAKVKAKSNKVIYGVSKYRFYHYSDVVRLTKHD